MTVLTLPTSGHPDYAHRVYRDVVPVDPPKASAAGPAPYRVLAVGGRLLAGHGVRTHDLALTGAIARGLAGLVGHGVDVESMIGEGVSLATLGRELKRRDLSKIDALIVILDQDERAGDGLELAKRVSRWADDLWKRLTPAASLTLVVPAAGRTSLEQQRAADFAVALRDRVGALTRIVRLADRLDVGGHAERYTTWGDTIAAVVAESLTEPLVWFDPIDELDERRRQHAVRALGAPTEQWQDAFRRIVSFAAQTYGVSSAALCLIDGDRTRYVVRRGLEVEDVEREQTLCDTALQTYGGLIVGDARVDPRFSGFPLVRSGEVRFYAGYRLESADGQPIGVLCVFDSEARPVLSQDLGLLRDFALAAQRRLWELTRNESSRGMATA